MGREPSLPRGPGTGYQTGLGRRKLQPLFAHLLAHEDRKRSASGNLTVIRQRAPFEEASCRLSVIDSTGSRQRIQS